MFSQVQTPIRVVFRADASHEIGAGHVSRCLTLAERLREKEVDCCFVSRRLEGHMGEQILSRGFEARFLDPIDDKGSFVGRAHEVWSQAEQAHDADRTRVALRDIGYADWLVVDHYSLSAAWHRRMRRQSRRLFVIDDLANRPYDCDLLLDQNVGRTHADYSDLTPKNCDLLIGPEHLLLRDEFVSLREHAIERRRRREPVRHILVNLGGRDTGGLTIKVLSRLSECVTHGMKVTVLLSSFAESLPRVRQRLEHYPCETELLTRTNSMAELVGDCDLAIATGGVSTYERIYLGLPSVVIPTAENQVAPLRAIGDLGLIQLCECPDDLIERLPDFLAAPLQVPDGCVGDGAGAISQRLVNDTIHLLRPGRDGIDRTYRWLLQPSLQEAFLVRAPDSSEENARYWARLEEDARQRVFAICSGNQHIGNAGLKNIDFVKGECELWLYVAEQQARRQGVARMAVKKLLDYAKHDLDCPSVYLHVEESNVPAIGLYQACGFRADPEPAHPSFFKQGYTVKRMKKSVAA